MNSTLHMRLLAVLMLGMLCLSAVPVFAQGGSPGGQTDGGTVGGQTDGGTASNGGLVNPLNNVETLPDFLKAILGGIVDIGTIILIMMLVYVGFLFVAARGNAEKLQSAKSALVWTVIGGLVLLGATSIQLVIEGTVNSLR